MFCRSNFTLENFLFELNYNLDEQNKITFSLRNVKHFLVSGNVKIFIFLSFKSNKQTNKTRKHEKTRQIGHINEFLVTTFVLFH